MKKNYTRLMMALVAAFTFVQGMQAQSLWKAHKAEPSAQVAAETRADEAGEIYVGHCNYTDYIYEYDGLSLDKDARVGVGIKLTRDLFEDYIGGSVEAIRCGWDDRGSSASYECFIRLGNFNSEVVASGTGRVAFGWNEVNLKESFIIPDTDTICVGFYVNLKKGVCSIPKFYPQYKPNSCFLYHGDKTEDGKEIWNDSRELGVMPIMIKIVDEKGEFSNMISVSDFRYDGIVPAGTDVVSQARITNRGTNRISSLEICSSLGDQQSTMTIETSQAIEQGRGSTLKLPLHCFGTGDTKWSITKVNGETPKRPIELTASLIGVPETVAENYSYRPMIEFFGSENSHSVPSYFDTYLLFGIDAYKEYYSVVYQHTDDKFMIGDPDEAVLLQLGLVNNDSMSVMIPSTTISRSHMAGNLGHVGTTPMINGVLFPEYGAAIYEAALLIPTFASVNVEANLDQNGEKVNVSVKGNIAEGILPENEKLNLTVYLLEYGVESSDQDFSTPEEQKNYGGIYTNYNVIRENLTPLWGKKLDVASGEYSMNFTADMYEDYNPANLKVIAFLNRGEENPYNQRQVINSNEVEVSIPDAIEAVEVGKSIAGEAWYDLSGRKVLKPAKGIYVKNGKKILVK